MQDFSSQAFNDEQFLPHFGHFGSFCTLLVIFWTKKRHFKMSFSRAGFVSTKNVFFQQKKKNAAGRSITTFVLFCSRFVFIICYAPPHFCTSKTARRRRKSGKKRNPLAKNVIHSIPLHCNAFHRLHSIALHCNAFHRSIDSIPFDPMAGSMGQSPFLNFKWPNYD